MSFKAAGVVSKSSGKALQQQVQSDLVVIEGRLLNRWDLLRKTWTHIPLTTEVEVDTESRWMWVEDWLFCSGGDYYLGLGRDYKGIRSTYSIKSDGKAIKLADMITPRGCHGLWWDRMRSKIVVFGGINLYRPQ